MPSSYHNPSRLFENIKYATPMTLFQVDGLAAGDGSAWVGCLVMYLIGIVFYVTAVQVFARRDLPI